MLEWHCTQVLQREGRQSSWSLLPLVGSALLPPVLAASAQERPIQTFERFLRARPHLYCVSDGNSVVLAPGKHCRCHACPNSQLQGMGMGMGMRAVWPRTIHGVSRGLLQPPADQCLQGPLRIAMGMCRSRTTQAYSACSCCFP